MPLVGALQDTFSTLDTTKWVDAAGGTAFTGVSVDGSLILACDTTVRLVKAAEVWDLTASAFVAEIVMRQPLETASNQSEMNMVISDSADSTDYLSCTVYGNANTIAFAQVVNSATVNSATVAHSAATRWVRVRNSGANVLWDTSPTGHVWTNRATWAKNAGLAITSMKPWLECYRWGGSGGSGTFDNVGLPALPGRLFFF